MTRPKKEKKLAIEKVFKSRVSDAKALALASEMAEEDRLRAELVRLPGSVPGIDKDGLVDIAFKITRTFSKMNRTGIYLSHAQSQADGQSQTTDGAKITVDFRDPSLLCRVQAMVAHILFQTSAKARDYFVPSFSETLANAVNTRRDALGKPAYPDAAAILAGLLTAIVNILDRQRVLSLWALLYMGSASDIYALNKADVHGEFLLVCKRGEADKAQCVERINSPQGALVWIGNGLTIADAVEMTGAEESAFAPLRRMAPYILIACQKVQFASFQGTLLMGRWLLSKLVDEILRELDEEEPQPMPDTQGMAEQAAQQMQDAMQQAVEDALDKSKDKKDEQNDEQEDDDQNNDGDEDGDNQQDNPPDDGGDDSDAGEDSDGGADFLQQLLNELQGKQPATPKPKEGGSRMVDIPKATREQRGVQGDPFTPKQATPQQRFDAIEELIGRARSQPPLVRDKLQRMCGNVVPSPYNNDYLRKQAEDVSAAAAKADLKTVDAIDAALDKTREEMAAIVEKTTAALRQTVVQTKDDSMIHGINARVVVTDAVGPRVDPRDVLTPEEMAQASRIKHQFERALCKKRNTLEESGDEIDIDAVIRRRVDPSGDHPVYKRTVSGRGFELLLLLDLSGSMTGAKIHQVQRAHALLSESLSLPFVRYEVLGFSTTNECDTVRLVKFPSYGVRMEDDVQGYTPLHHALVGAVNKLSSSTEGVRHLLVLTDGLPNVMSSNGRLLDGEFLLKDIGETVALARKTGIHTTALAIGEEVADLQMTKMFGREKYWGRLAPHNLADGLYNTVMHSFRQFMRAL